MLGSASLITWLALCAEEIIVIPAPGVGASLRPGLPPAPGGLPASGGPEGPGLGKLTSSAVIASTTAAKLSSAVAERVIAIADSSFPS